LIFWSKLHKIISIFWFDLLKFDLLTLSRHLNLFLIWCVIETVYNDFKSNLNFCFLFSFSRLSISSADLLSDMSPLGIRVFRLFFVFRFICHAPKTLTTKQDYRRDLKNPLYFKLNNLYIYRHLNLKLFNLNFKNVSL